MRNSKCKICRSEFMKRSMSHKTCKPECAMELVRQNKEKAERKALKIRKEAIKTRQEWLKDVERVVNIYVRLRDRYESCISCDRSWTWRGQWHASHYKSVGSNSALRYNLFNIHKACSICNNHLSGNIGEYIPRLKKRIGDDRVKWLDNHPKSRDYRIEYLKRFKDVFLKKIKRLERRLRNTSPP